MSGQPAQTADPFDILKGLPADISGHPQGDPFDVLKPIGEQMSQEAQGIEHVTWGVKAGLKALGDGAMNAVTGITKLAGAAIGATADVMHGPYAMTGKGGGEGWNAAKSMISDVTGSEDPSILDIFGGDNTGISYGKQYDELIAKRLGNEALVWQTIGNLGSFAVGPGAMIGKGAAALARPMAGVAERMIARSVAKGVEGASDAIKSGEIWQFLAKSPEWQKSATTLQRLGGFAGRNTQDMLGTTASVIAQSWATSPDANRGDAALMAMATAPFILPLARIGEKIGGAFAQKGLSPEQATVIKAAFDDVAAGKLDVSKLDSVIRANSSTAWRLFGQGVVAPAFEGTAFMGLDPSARKEAQKWWAGDSEAGSRLMAMWLGTVAGVAAVKYAVPHDLIPFFKVVRPDINKLDTYIEAEANKRADQQIKPGEQEPNQKQVNGEWQPLSPEQVTALSEQQQKDYEVWRQGAHDRPFVKKEGSFKRQQDIQQAEKIAQDAKAQYGWADAPSLGLLRSGWEPEFDPNSSNVTMRFGRDHSVTLSQEGGETSVTMDPRMEGILNDFGRSPSAALRRDVLSPSQVRYRGSDAKKVLDDLSLIGSLRRMQGDLTYERLGMREVASGVWTNDKGTHYTVQMDGTSATRSSTDNRWTGFDNIQAIGFPSTESYDSQSLQQLKLWLTQKYAIAPDNLTDSVVANAISMAQHSSSVGAEQLREFFDNVPMEALSDKLNKDGYDFLAIELGSIASGNNSARQAASEIAADSQIKAMKAAKESKTVTTDAPTDQAASVDAPPQEATPDRQSFGEQVREQQQQSENGAVGSAGGQVARAVIEQAKPYVKAGSDYAFRDLPDRLSEQSPGETYGHEVRRVQSEASRIEAEAIDKARPMEKALYPGARKRTARREASALRDQYVEHPTVPGLRRTVVGELIDKNIAPKNAREKSIQESGQAANQMLRDRAVDAGMFRVVTDENGNAVHHPLEKAGKSVLQFIEGKDYHEIMSNESLRKDFFDKMAKANAMETYVRDKNGNPVYEGRGRDRKVKKKPLTGEDLEAEYKAEVTKNGPDVAEKKSAVEFQRRFKYLPHRFTTEVRGKEEHFQVQEENAIAAITYAARKQAARIAEFEQFGPNLGKAEREAMKAQGKAEGWSEASMASLDKTGIDQRLVEVQKKLRDRPNNPDEAQMMDMVRNMTARMQATEPIRETKFTKFIKPYSTISSGAMSAWAFVRDLAEPFLRNPALVGFVRSMKALRVLNPRNYREVVHYMEREAGLQQVIGDYAIDEAKTIPRKIADAFAWLASKTERIKGAVAGEVSRSMLKSFEAKTATAGDFVYAEDLLRLSAEDMAALRDGKVSPELRGQFLKESVQFLTSRVKRGQGTEMADNPNLRGVLRFTGFITQRIQSHLRVMESVARSSDTYGKNSPEHRAAIKRLLGTMAGLPVIGAVGNAISYFLTDTLDGSLGGFKRWYDQASYAPLYALGDSAMSQVLGGPFASAVRAATSSEDASAWANLTIPTQLLRASGKGIYLALKGDLVGATQTLGDYGIIPMQAQLSNLVANTLMRGVGDPQFRTDSKLVWSWRRMENATPSTGGDRHYPEAFYQAMSRVVQHAAKNGGDHKEAMQSAMVDIKKALELAPSESVASSILSRRLLEDLSPEQRVKLADFVGSEETMRRLYQHDEALRLIAKEVRKMEGAKPEPLDLEIQQVVSQAKLGAKDDWSHLMSRAVEQAAANYELGDGVGQAPTDVANALARFPEHFDAVFQGKQLQILMRTDDTVRRAMFIRSILTKRAVDRFKEGAKARARNP